MNHCPECRDDHTCDAAKRMQVKVDKLELKLCPRKGCKQWANHDPGGFLCDDPKPTEATESVEIPEQMRRVRILKVDTIETKGEYL